MGFISEETLIKSALGTAICGIILLLLAIQYYGSVKILNPESVLLEKEGSLINLEGIVKSASVKGNTTIITLFIELPVIIFENVSVDAGRRLIVSGKSAEYNGKKEVLAEKIEYIE